MEKNHDNRSSILVLCLISMVYLTFALACDLLAYKILKFGNWPIIGASILFPMTYAFMDFISEIYGNHIAKIVIWFHVFCDFLFTYIICWIIHLPSPDFWHYQEAYNQVIDPMARLYTANFLGMITSALLNIFILRKLRIFTQGKYYWIRSFISIAISITIYTLITDLLAYNLTATKDILTELTLVNLISNISFAFFYSGIFSLFVRPTLRFIGDYHLRNPVRLFNNDKV